jgi:HAD superfamily hydrolase (TIGR01490 family)
LRRSSALALARPFRAHGVISRSHLARAAVWQVLFSALGADERRVRRAAETGLLLLRGHRPEDIRAIVTGALETVLRPLVYREPLDLVAHHRAHGEPVYIVTTTLQEVADAIADDLGFDGALGTVCEVGEDGTYTGHSLRPMYGGAKVDAVRSLGHDLDASTAYSDGHTDLPLLEAVGHPVAVNPDRRLRRIAAERGWPVLRFRDAA